MTFDEKILRINACINDWFAETGNVEARPKDLMEYLIKKGVYTKDHREGLPLRNDLRRLKAENKMDMISSLRPEQNGANTNWYFRRQG